MSIVTKRGVARVEANLTPMIDVVFLLIVFFVLVSQIVDLENIKEITLPALIDPASEIAGEEQRVVVNVEPGIDGDVKRYKLGGQFYAADLQGIKAMTVHLADLYKINPSLSVNLRADASTHYKWVEPVMQAVANAAVLSQQPNAVPRVNLVVVRED